MPWEEPQQAAYVISETHGGRLFTRCVPMDRINRVVMIRDCILYSICVYF